MDETGTFVTPNELLMNRNIKDSVFRDLFSDKNYLFQLYQALHPDDKDSTIDDLEYVTLENILAHDIYNDLGFKVGQRLLILVEAQSTWTENIIIRCLLYMAKTLQDYLKTTKQSLFAQKPVKIPKPELYVVYTGISKMKKNSIKLSEEFFEGKETGVDVRVEIITDGERNNIIHQYVMFTKVADEQIRQFGRNRKAIIEAIRICKDEDILREYLTSHESEVTDIMITLNDQKEVLEDLIASEIREQREEDVLRISRVLYENGTSVDIIVDIIAKAYSVPVKTVEKWLDNIIVTSKS